MKKMEWMVAAGTVAALAGAAYSAGCANTAGDCALVGTCGEGGGTSSSTTATSATSSASSSSSSSSSSSGTGGGMPDVKVCESSRFGGPLDQAAKAIHVSPNGDMLLAGDFQGSLSIGNKSVSTQNDDVFVGMLDVNLQAKWLKSLAVPYGAVARNPKDGSIVLAGPYLTMANLGCLNMLDASTDLYVTKLDAITGKCLWAKGFNAPSAHVSVAVAPSGNIALAGDSMGGPMDFDGSILSPLAIAGGGPGGGRDLFIVELDAAGGHVSSAAYGGTADDVANGVAFDATGGIVVTGVFKSPTLDFATGASALANPKGDDRAFVARTGGTGKSWFVGFAGGGAGQQHATAVAVEGSVALVAGDFTDTFGTLKSAAGNTAFFLVGLDLVNGKTTWGQSFDGAGPKTIRAIATSGGNVALAGTITGDVNFGFDKLASQGGAVVANLDATSGKAIWNRGFGNATSVPAANALSFQGENIFVAGGFAAELDLGVAPFLKSAGGMDIFVTSFSTICP